MNILECLVGLLIVFVCSCEAEIACGIKQSPARSLIQGGIASKANDWPWMAAIFYLENAETKNERSLSYFCPGTLISAKIVLTAAHCIHEKHSTEALAPEKIEVQLGRFNLTADETNVKRFQPIKIVIHPDWNVNSIRYDADLALLIAQNDLRTPQITPICLFDQNVVDASNENVVGTIVGYGFTSNSIQNIAETPQQIQIKRVSLAECFLEDASLAEIFSMRTFCVAGLKKATGPCTGDGGSGFYVRSGNIWIIHGIISSTITAENCPTIRHSLSTDLSEFTEWIKRKIAEHSI